MIIQCGWCKRPLGEKAPLDNTSITTGICPGCARQALIDENVCPRCNGPLLNTPWGDKYCKPCSWYFGPPLEGDPGEAPAEMVDVLEGGNDIVTLYGVCKAPRRDRFRRGPVGY